METPSGWHAWKNMMGKIVNMAESVGISTNRVNDTVFRVGDFFANNFDPENREMRLLKELWDEADDGQKKVLSSLIVRMLEKTEPQRQH